MVFLGLAFYSHASDQATALEGAAQDVNSIDGIVTFIKDIEEASTQGKKVDLSLLIALRTNVTNAGVEAVQLIEEVQAFQKDAATRGDRWLSSELVRTKLRRCGELIGGQYKRDFLELAHLGDLLSQPASAHASSDNLRDLISLSRNPFLELSPDSKKVIEDTEEWLNGCKKIRLASE